MSENSDKLESSLTCVDEAATLHHRSRYNETLLGVAPSTTTTQSLPMKDDNEMTNFLS